MTNLAPHRSWSWRIQVGVVIGALALVVMLARLVIVTPSAEARADTTLTVLYSFKGRADGSSLYAGLVRDAAGNLYGTTPYGGASDIGTVFKVDATGAETVLHSFTGTPDGSQPYAGLVRDAEGSLYGTTYTGGNFGKGMVFKLDTAGQLTALHSFPGAPDGQFPNTKLVRDAAGNLYGTTELGGNPKCNFTNGCGTVFKLDATGTETVLHSFTARPLDGAFPEGGLARNAAGNLYGTTYFGGASDFGTVFKLDNAGVETVLYSFTGGTTDGAYPLAGLLQGATGNLYGTTNLGGASNLGTVFRVTTSGTETVLHSLRGGEGKNPRAGLVRDTAGNLYGTTSSGGPFNKGTVFKLSP